MAKIQAVWAIDIGQAAMKALKLVPGEGPEQVVAEAFDFIEYPKILSQPDADPEELVREALQTFLGRNDLKGCKVAIAVPGQAGLVKFIKLPPVEKKRIPDIVKFEARQQIPFALEEVIWDYQAISGDGDGEDFATVEVGLFAMKRDQINRAILPLTVAGIQVDIVQMGPISLYNFATFDQADAADKSKGSVVYLDIGADNTDLIITDGARIWQRNVPIGGNHFTRALTKELKLTFAKAEHLKRNATKAPDPRAVFTAMRGVFNDFSSEVSRSIGFYSSVNRTAKIAKIVGLGNGFKLPGLQKFLQQNLNQEVDKLEVFQHMVAGADVNIQSGQFQENLPSFAVAYGLGLQGLGRSKLRTNLLPPEIEQIRMVRRKKPWVLAASALLMLGFSFLFVGEYRALATVTSPQFDTAVKDATAVAKEGGDLQSEFDTKKGEWDKTLKEGEALVPDFSDPTNWSNLLVQLNNAIPDPVRDRRDLNPDKASDRDLIDKTRVHVDAIKPVWASDVKAVWYDGLPDSAKVNSLAYDRKNVPTGEGWIIQIIGHHFNPAPTTKEARDAGVDLGPGRFIREKILTRLGMGRYRQFGFRCPTLVHLAMDDKWSGEAIGANPLPANIPIIDRQIAAATTATSAADARGGQSQGGGGGGMSDRMKASGYGAGGGGSAEAMGMGGGRQAGGQGGRSMQSVYDMAGGADTKKDKLEVKTFTRTDFKIDLIWQPPKADAPKKSVAEWDKEISEAQKEKGATKIPSDADFAKESQDRAERVNAQIEASEKQEAAPAKAAAPAPVAPAAAPKAAGPATK